MPILVETPHKGVVEFPDGMATEDIARVIKRDALLTEREELAKSEQPSTPSLFLEELFTPFVDIPNVSAVPETSSGLRKFGTGLLRGGEHLAESIISPGGVATIAASALPGVGKAIGVLAAGGFGTAAVIEGGTQMVEAVKTGDAEKAGEATAMLAASALMLGTAVKQTKQLAQSTKVVPLTPERPAQTLGDSLKDRVENIPPEPPEPPPLSVAGGENLNAAVARPGRAHTIFDSLNSRQFAFSFGKLGENAKAAWEEMALGEFRMREAIEKDTQFLVEDTLKRLPADVRKEGGKAFFEALDGRSIEEIRTEWEGRPNGEIVIEQAEKVKGRLEEIRETIRDTKRDTFQNYLDGLSKPSLARLYKANVDPIAEVGTLLADTGMPKAELAARIAEVEYPADWGIADGSYLPHIFTGQWKASVKQGETTRFVLRAQTPQEAKIRLAEFLEANPEMKGSQFTIEADMNLPADVLRLGDRQFFDFLGRMREKMDVSPEEARDATLGLVGRKASKQKWWGSLQRRLGAENYEKEFSKAMSAYLSGFHRWKVLSEVQREVQPLIETVAAEGKKATADELTSIMDYLWGKPADTTTGFDNFLQTIPFVRDRVKPLALDRWLRSVRSVGATAFLTTPRFFVLNRLQPLQGLYPLIGESTLLKAKAMQHTQAGKALLESSGVTSDTGTFGELGTRGKIERTREQLTGERSNQELAFLGMYLHGLNRGLDAVGATRYAKLRGQLFTQFTPLAADTPPFMRGPIGATVFQFSRFPIKQLELISRIVSERDVPAAFRLLGSYAVLGGASLLLYSGFRDKERLEMQRKLTADYGEDTSNLILYGLPGFLGIDMSGSLALIDEPWGDSIYETLGRRITGPVGSAAIDLTRAALTEERAPTSTLDDSLSLAKRIPALKAFAEGIDLLRGNVDVLSPDGETAYRRALTEALLNMGSFRTTERSNERTSVDAVMELQKERASLENAFFVAVQRTDNSSDEVLSQIDKFNDRWPELAITGKDLNRYVKQRVRGVEQTDIERAVGKRGQMLLPENQQ